MFPSSKQHSDLMSASHSFFKLMNDRGSEVGSLVETGQSHVWECASFCEFAHISCGHSAHSSVHISPALCVCVYVEQNRKVLNR